MNIKDNSTVIFNNNRDNFGGALRICSDFTISGNSIVIFSSNNGIFGDGTLSATGKSNAITFSLRFINNSTNDQGGVIKTVTIITIEENCNMVFYKNKLIFYYPKTRLCEYYTRARLYLV